MEDIKYNNFFLALYPSQGKLSYENYNMKKGLEFT
jgi:hypothetical protein